METIEIDTCIHWLTKYTKSRKTFNKFFTTYKGKHMVEDMYEMYISESSFISACLILHIDFNKNNQCKLSVI